MLKQLLKRSLVKDSATLLSGNMWAQFVSFAAYLLLTRLYSPDEFGLYAVFYSYIEIFIILSTFKYELSAVLATDDREAAAVGRLALRLNSIVSALLFALVLVIHFLLPNCRIDLVTHHLGLSLLIPVMVFFCGTSRVYIFLFNRFRGFRQIALSDVVTSTSGVFVKILLGLLRPLSYFHSIGLALGTVIGKMAGNINFLIRLRELNLPKDLSKEEIRAVAYKYRRFPLYTMPKDFLNSFSYNLPFLCLALYFDKAQLGLFSLALTITLRPVNLLNNAFEKALYVRISDKVRQRLSIRSDIYSFLRYVNIVAFPCMLLAFFFAEPVFSFLFGSRWVGCGYYVRCLLPWVLVSLTSTSLMFISNVFEKQRGEFLFYVVLLLLRAASVAIGILTANLRLSILLFALSGMVVSLSLLLWYLRLVRSYESSLTITPVHE